MSYEKDADLDGEPQLARPASVFGWLIDGLNGAGSLLIFATMFLVCADVIARDFFNSPIHGVAEMVALSIIAILFLQLASTLRHGRMSCADIFIGGFRQKHPVAGGLLQAFFDLCGVAVCVIIVYTTLPVFDKAWSGNQFIGVQGIFTAPTWPVRAIVILGAAAAGAQYVVNAWSNLQAAQRGGRGRS